MSDAVNPHNILQAMDEIERYLLRKHHKKEEDRLRIETAARCAAGLLSLDTEGLHQDRIADIAVAQADAIIKRARE